MTKATTRNFFFGGTILFSAAFVLLTVQTHGTIAERTHEEKLTAQVQRGGAVWARYNCENCHTLLGEGAYFAPDLTKIVEQRGAAYLAQFLDDPSRFYSEERDGRLMPTLGLSGEEIAEVVAFLGWVGQIDTNGWPPRPILVAGVAPRGMPGVSGVAESDRPESRGKALFDGAGACVTCHSIESGVTLVGPSLSGLTLRSTERVHDPAYQSASKSPDDYLKESILAPSAFIAPGGRYATPEGTSLMPDTYSKTLKPEQVADLVAYLKTLR